MINTDQLGSQRFKMQTRSGSVVGRGRPPYRAPRTGSCLTLRKELSKETRADKARDFIGKGMRVESSRVREPRKTALPRGLQSRVLW